MSNKVPSSHNRGSAAVRWLTVAATLSVLVATSMPTLPAESRPDATVAFHATFDSQSEAQAYLATFFLAKKYQVRMGSRGAPDFLYARSSDLGDVVATGGIRPGVRICVLVDFQFASIDVDVLKRDAHARTRALSEAADLVEWLRSSGSEGIKLYDFASWEERSKC